jgi:murein DD-endopeptidase MepM/ murein hydrolase activator NlpD
MDRYTLIVVSDDRSPVRRFEVPKILVKRIAAGAGVLALLCLLATWDYWRKWADNLELDGLRIEAAEQREQIAGFQRTLADAEAELTRVKDLERKVRIIANLPGSAAVGGAGVAEISAQPLQGQADQLLLPVGVPVEGPPLSDGQGGYGADWPVGGLDVDEAGSRALTTEGARQVLGLSYRAGALSEVADTRAVSLEHLLSQLEDKRVKLVSMPSIWPARGWLTSRYGARVSPFTGRTQKHSGIDIASRLGTPIIAPAEARVSYVGAKGPLGNTLMLDHGFGVKTIYGHTHEIYVKAGDRVERGQKIAAIGSTGRSTGPHLHYVVEVKGKTRNPLDYIFD